jgi:hypothetical protein
MFVTASSKREFCLPTELRTSHSDFLTQQENGQADRIGDEVQANFEPRAVFKIESKVEGTFEAAGRRLLPNSAKIRLFRL